MLRETSRLELALWFAHLKVGSLDDEADDVRAAIIATAAMNGPHFVKFGKKPYELRDFLPERSRPEEDVSKQVREVFKRMGK